MADTGIQHTEHEITIDATAEVVYGLVADVTRWPQIFAPTVHVDHVERDGDRERIRIWATANGEVKNWTSGRRLDRTGRRILFRQEVSQPPVAAMGGTWELTPMPAGHTQVVLKHDYSMLTDAQADLDWVARAVDRNSSAELAALKTAAELGPQLDELIFSFDDTVAVSGDPAVVYDFLRDGARWPERVPHVARLELREDVPDIQLMEMDTRTANGSVHTTKSVRVCFPHDRIVYKQVEVPPLLLAHTGHWMVGADAVTSRHTVTVNKAAVGEILGADATIADARVFLRNALGGNSIATLKHAMAYAEGRRNG